MSRSPVAILFFVAVAALSAGCRSDKAPITPKPGPPERIVSLAPNVTEILFEIGAGDRVVGVTRFCDHPAEAAALPKVGGFVDPSFEAVLAQRPDLVIGIRDEGIRRFLERLEQVGVGILPLEMGSLGEIRAGIRAIAKTVDRAAQGDELVDAMDRGLATVSSRVAQAPRRRVLMVYGHRPLVVAGGGTFPDALITRAGGSNVAAASRVTYPTWSMEQVVHARPDVIVDCSMIRGAAQNEHAFEGWEAIPAVRDGRVVRLFDPTLLRPGPRIAKGLELLARAIHPEAFERTAPAPEAP